VSKPDCTHRPTSRDIGAGYDACMFCVEIGDCNRGKGFCRPHSVTWDVYEDRAADAENSAF
jgi:hypothetical protein